MAKKLTFLVTVKVDDHVTVASVKDHVKQAVGWWGRQLPPDDPLFDLEPRKVSVKSFHRNGAK